MSAGQAFEARIRAEQEAARAQRAREREEEIAKARASYVEHADAVTRVAREKEQAELAEKKRLAEIDAHMQEMRGEKGAQVRAKVMEKVQQGAAGGGAGARWEEENKRERQERERQRERERQEEIERARDKYLESLRESKMTAAEKERAWLAEQKRLADIDEHMGKVRHEKEETVSATTNNKAPAVPETKGRVLKYEEIKGRKKYYLYAEDFDANHLEAYLDDAEFFGLFQMTKDKFYATPAWKREEVLKKLDLF